MFHFHSWDLQLSLLLTVTALTTEGKLRILVNSAVNGQLHPLASSCPTKALPVPSRKLLPLPGFQPLPYSGSQSPHWTSDAGSLVTTAFVERSNL